MKHLFVNGILSGMLALGFASCGTEGGGVDEGDVVSSSVAVSSSAVAGPVVKDYSVARAMNARLGRGINLGNCLEGPNEGSWGCTIEQRYMDSIKSAGFQSVRIPVRWSNKTMQGAIDPSFKSRVLEVVQWANAAGLVAIVDIHHFDELTKKESPYDLESQKLLFYSIWNEVSTLLKDIPDNMLVLELLNEPTDRVTPDIHNELVANVIPMIRQTNPTRTLMVGLTSFGKWNGAKDLRIPDNENNIIMTFHYYDPMGFTHQGTNFGTAYPLGVGWGSNQEKVDMGKFFKRVADSLNVLFPSTDGLGIPTTCGEFGAHSNGNLTDRATWTQTVRENLEAYGMSFAYWEFNQGFGAFNNAADQWIPELKNALVPPR